MGTTSESFCSCMQSLIGFWLLLEKAIIKAFLLKPVRNRIRKLYLLDSENKDLVLVNNDEFYIQSANKGLLGACEAYMNEWISVKDVDVIITNVLSTEKYWKDLGVKYKSFLDCLNFEVFSTPSTGSVVLIDGNKFSIDNDLYEATLGPTMCFSCAIWNSPNDTLEIAQLNKMETIAKKMLLKPGMGVLDVGCGWGGLTRHLAQNYGVSVLGTTISSEGANYTRNYCKGLPVEVLVSDCRDSSSIPQQFDRILAVQVLVHVGKKNYKSFFNNLSKWLKDDGIVFLQVVGSNHTKFPPVNGLHNSILPTTRVPYIKDIIEATEDKFVVEDWCNIGADFDKTWIAWNDNFQRSRPTFEAKHGEKFCRMWEFFLLSNAAISRSRHLQIWHIVLSKKGLRGGYKYS